MNRIEAVYNRSLYSAEEHLDIRIDGEILTSYVDRKFSDRDLAGLVPTLLNWLSDEEERKIVWERILPNVGKSSVAPLLMCPDDCDFFCTLIVVEIERTQEFVLWKRFGRDDSEFTVSNLSNIGSKVRWFSDPEEYRFPIRDYAEFLNRFKREL
ncbi:hypothetical protein EHQ05_15445 [Leptospira yasudae]|uniref:hypothetical protein n=1 Tax=Leptospira yasudae TaxID=2202201 RepID=UPI0010847586|nr:hypothetical protein [Leptospira yasudae]TGK24321.1 hypothetical protein EHQ05_15445 [Leptospira yasudae]TGM05891.1 hypothetical protein EHQ86_10780 [Leptospira yasudae]